MDSETEDVNSEIEETLDSPGCPDMVDDGLTLSASGRVNSYYTLCICYVNHDRSCYWFTWKHSMPIANGKCRETNCNSIYHVYHKFCLIIEGRCANGHTFNWELSPSMNTYKCKSYVDNLDFASAIVLSGNNFTKMKLFCQFLGLPCISKTTFQTYQRLFICPIIDRHYKLEQVS